MVEGLCVWLDLVPYCCELRAYKSPCDMRCAESSSVGEGNNVVGNNRK